MVIDNTISNNSRRDPGKYSGIFVSKSSKTTIKGNHCFDDQQTKTQKCGIEELSGCHDNTIVDNNCHDNLKADIVLAKDQAEPPARGRH